MRYALVCAGVVLLGLLVHGATAQERQRAQEAQWAMNATIIEACSCPMFCQCYFDTKPAAHGGGGGHGGHGEHAGGEHFCRFNNAFRVNTGHWGDVKLDGAKFWVAGDLGGDFSEGKLDWAMLFFDPSVTKEQREAIKQIVAHVYPAEWNSFTIGDDAKMQWEATKDRAVARADEGRVAEVVLKRAQGMTDDPIVMHNLRYWGAPRNDGFIMMPNEVQALRKAPEGQKPYEFKGTNGFMITLDINANDLQGR
jgi:hypothetical protein